MSCLGDPAGFDDVGPAMVEIATALRVAPHLRCPHARPGAAGGLHRPRLGVMAVDVVSI